MKLILTSGSTGFFNERNEFVCTGSQMGRPIRLADKSKPVKLHLRKLHLTDGNCYDAGGAYWGSPSNLYMAFTAYKVYSPIRARFELIPAECQIFIRADNREDAKIKTKAIQPNATFYR